MPITSLTSYFNTASFGDTNASTRNQQELALTLDAAAQELANWKSLLTMSAGGGFFEGGRLAARVLLGATPALCAVPFLANVFTFAAGAIADTGLTGILTQAFGNEGEESETFFERLSGQGSVRVMSLLGAGQSFVVVQLLIGLTSVSKEMVCGKNPGPANGAFLHHLVSGLSCYFGSGMFTCLSSGVVNAAEQRMSLKTRNVGTPHAPEAHQPLAGTGALRNLGENISNAFENLSAKLNPQPLSPGPRGNSGKFPGLAMMSSSDEGGGGGRKGPPKLPPPASTAGKGRRTPTRLLPPPGKTPPPGLEIPPLPPGAAVPVRSSETRTVLEGGLPSESATVLDGTSPLAGHPLPTTLPDVLHPSSSTDPGSAGPTIPVVLNTPPERPLIGTGGSDEIGIDPALLAFARQDSLSEMRVVRSEPKSPPVSTSSGEAEMSTEAGAEGGLTTSDLRALREALGPGSLGISAMDVPALARAATSSPSPWMIDPAEATAFTVHVLTDPNQPGKPREGTISGLSEGHGSTHPGFGKLAHNEDALGVIVDAEGKVRAVDLSDESGGVGDGTDRGSISALAVEQTIESLKGYLSKNPHLDPEKVEIHLRVAFEKVHTIIAERGCAATLMIAVDIAPGHKWLFWVGDSKAFYLRPHEGQAWAVLVETEGHHMGERLAKRFGPVAAMDSPMRNTLHKALGIKNHTPDVVEVKNLQNGDWEVLCSDGLLSALTKEGMIRVLKSLPAEASDQQAHEALQNSALMVMRALKEVPTILASVKGEGATARLKLTLSALDQGVQSVHTDGQVHYIKKLGERPLVRFVEFKHIFEDTIYVDADHHIYTREGECLGRLNGDNLTIWVRRIRGIPEEQRPMEELGEGDLSAVRPRELGPEDGGGSSADMPLPPTYVRPSPVAGVFPNPVVPEYVVMRPVVLPHAPRVTSRPPRERSQGGVHDPSAPPPSEFGHRDALHPDSSDEMAAPPLESVMGGFPAVQKEERVVSPRAPSVMELQFKTTAPAESEQRGPAENLPLPIVMGRPPTSVAQIALEVVLDRTDLEGLRGKKLPPAAVTATERPKKGFLAGLLGKGKPAKVAPSPSPLQRLWEGLNIDARLRWIPKERNQETHLMLNLQRGESVAMGAQHFQKKGSSDRLPKILPQHLVFKCHSDTGLVKVRLAPGIKSAFSINGRVVESSDEEVVLVSGRSLIRLPNGEHPVVFTVHFS